jgi:hypothetical protein
MTTPLSRYRRCQMMTRLTTLTAALLTTVLACVAFYVAASLPGILGIFGVIFGAMVALALLKMLSVKFYLLLTRPVRVRETDQLPSMAAFAADAT